MCGICGIVVPRESGRTIDEALLIGMRDTIRHRGPDDSGLFLDHGVGLGHRRLSIVDLAGGHQPIASDDGNLHITYNGEIYNHVSLRSDLERRGHTYRTRSDTETVLRLYQEEGRRSVQRLRGMFAFAIWNRVNRQLFLARDRFGIKPLYYVHAEDGSLFFASEIKALLAAGAVRPKLNLRAFPDYLANHAPSGNDTLFQGVRRLPPGHILMWHDGTLTIERYWKLGYDGPEGAQTNQADLIRRFHEQFREAVELRLMADVPLGMFLSGGIDSAAISAMMSTLVDEPIKTFSVAFAEQEANELRYARLIAARYHTDHQEIVVSPEEFFTELPRLVWHEDEPIAHPSSIALHFVSRLAAESVKVVLTGEGSDELLGGYGRYLITLKNLAWGSRYQRLAGTGMQRLVKHAIDRLPQTMRLRRRLRRTALYLPAAIDDLYFENFAVFNRAQQAALLAPAVHEQLQDIDPYAELHHAFENSEAETLLDRLLEADRTTYLHELLMKQDQMSMAASIESRVPFLDHELAQFTARLPQSMKIRGLTTKYILREAMKPYLPAEILRRGKMGFPVPVGRWFREGYRPIVEEFVLGERARARGLFAPAAVESLVAEHHAKVADHSERLWTLVNCELWHRIFLDGQSPDDVTIPLPTASTRMQVTV